MKLKKTFTLLAIGMSMSYSFAQDAYHCSRIKGHNHTETRSARLSDHYIDLTTKYDVHFYNLDIELQRTSSYISGVVQIHAIATEAMDTVLFELWDDFTIDDILLNGATALAFTRDESAVIVPVSIAMGESFFLEITYDGLPPTGGGPLGGGGMTNDNSFTWGNQVTWSLSEPFAAYEWFPCKQLLTDKADSSAVSVTTDATNMAGSNGLLIDVVDVSPAIKRYEWKSNYPIDYYLISVAVAEYVEYSIYADPVGADEPILVQNFIYNNPACLPYFKDDIDETVDFIEHYSTLFGLYPFDAEKYGHCMAPIGGGMEHQTMTTQGYFNKGLTSHELAHQWFGDNVTAGSWSDIWLNEGFASYAEELMLAEFYPGEDISSMLDRHANVMEEPGGSVWVEDSLNVGRIFNGRLTYNKGAAIIHTLRYLINNDDLFFETLQNYQTTFGGSTAILNDFKSVAETVSGLDLTAFFNEWYYGQGYPTYSVEYSVVDGELIVLLEQSVSMPSETPFFTNDLTLRVQNTDGDFFNLRLTDIDGVTSYHSFDFVGSVTSVSIDPENWIINQVGTITENNNLAYLSEEKAIELSVYPNPTVDFIHITDITGNGFYTILNTEGKTVLAGSLTVDANKIDVEDLPNGQYFIQFNGGKTTFTKL